MLRLLIHPFFLWLVRISAMITILNCHTFILCCWVVSLYHISLVLFFLFPYHTYKDKFFQKWLIFLPFSFQMNLPLILALEDFKTLFEVRSSRRQLGFSFFIIAPKLEQRIFRNSKIAIIRKKNHFFRNWNIVFKIVLKYLH